MSAQTLTNPIATLSPNGVLDTLGDRFGNTFTLKDILIDDDFRKQMGGSGERNDLLCSNSGYFNLYFEAGALGTSGTPQAILDARRNVFCQVFTDLSAFIQSPLTANGNKVNIWIRNISNITNQAGVLGAASDFYVFPPNNPNLGGIIDGQVWKTINSGIDAYTNVVSPLTGAGIGNSPNGLFFHGLMGINFINYSWNTSPTANSNATQYDLYTVLLHEATHILGFNSLINFNGQSVYGPNRPFFSRYDRFLRTQGGVNLLTQFFGVCGTMYNYRYNPSLSQMPTVVNPNGTPPCAGSNNTPCGTAIRYQSSFSQLVYTPSCYESGSSLSHFEDQCHVPVGQNPQPPNSNDLYFVMSNANGQGQSFVKRFLKPVERTVLCDIGYRVNTSYGGTFANSFINYGGSVCSNIGIVGVNDGITATGNYQYVTNVGQATASISPTINDYNFAGIPTGNPFSLTFECLQVVYGAGSISNPAGTSFTFTPSQAGLHLLRYVPVETSTGKRGNITYIYVWANFNNCVPSSCNLVNNGGFENSTINCASSVTSEVNCWLTYCSSPDLFGRNCSNTQYTIPTNQSGNAYNAGVDSYNGVGNNRFIGLWATGGGNVNDIEAVQTILSSPILNGQVYRISFWARRNNLNINEGLPGLITIYGDPNGLSVPLNPPLSLASSTVLLFQSTVLDNNQWQYFSGTFTYNGVAPLNRLIIANDIRSQTYSNTNRYTFVDDISVILESVAPSITVPQTIICNTESLPISLFPAGGTLTGPGITGNASSGFVFNGNLANLGANLLTYIVTQNGCTNSTYITINVNNNCGCECPASGLPEFVIPSGITSASQLTQTELTGRCIRFTQNFNIDVPMSFTDCQINVSPGVRITNNSRTSINSTAIRGCGQMWEGILNRKDLFVTTNSVIQDAQYAITMARIGIPGFSTSTNIFNSTLTKNFIAITHDGNMNAHPLNLINSTISGGILLNNYSGQTPAALSRSFAGIHIFNGYSLTVNQGNSFSDLCFGIIARSNAVLFSNKATYDRISGFAAYSGTAYFMNPSNPIGSAISADQSTVTVVGLGRNANSPLTFGSCTNGISVNNSNLDVSFSRFGATTLNNNTVGIRVSNLSSLRTLVIQKNRLNHLMEGIRIFQSDNMASGLVAHNHITGQNQFFGYALAGIWVSNFTQSPNLLLLNNTIEMFNGSASAAGIFIRNSGGINVKGNAITLGAATALCGIDVAQTPNAVFECNSITGSSTTTSQVGFRQSASPNALIDRNFTNNTNIGFNFLLANSPTNFTCNEIRNHFNGLQINTNASLGNQNQKGNRWTGMYSNWGAIKDPGNPDLFFVHASAANTIWRPSHSPSLLLCSQDPFIRCVNIVPNPPTCSICPLIIEGPGGSSMISAASNDLNIEAAQATAQLAAAHELTFETFNDELNFATRKTIDDLIEKEKLILPDTGIFIDFKNELATGSERAFNHVDNELNAFAWNSINKEVVITLNNQVANLYYQIYQLDSLMADNDDFDNPAILVSKELLLTELEVAKQQLQSLAQEIEQYQSSKKVEAEQINLSISAIDDNANLEKLVNEVYLQTIASKNYSLSANQIALLESIIYLCPAINSSAVYKARSLYYIVNDTITYNDTELCASQGIAYRHGKPNPRSSQSDLMKLFPNPSNGIVNMEISKEGSYNLFIYNQMGQQVFQQNIQDQQLTIDLSALNLSAGVFLFKLMNLESGKSEHQKVIYHGSR